MERLIIRVTNQLFIFFKIIAIGIVLVSLLLILNIFLVLVFLLLNWRR